MPWANTSTLAPEPDPQARRLSITWELTRNASFQAPTQIYLEWSLGSVLSKPCRDPGDSEAGEPLLLHLPCGFSALPLSLLL